MNIAELPDEAITPLMNEERTAALVLERAKLKILARLVLHQQHFNQIISQVEPSMRHAVYDQLKPLLRFKPKPFVLMKFSRG